MKNVVKKILEPNKLIGFIMFNLGMGLLIYVFSFHLEETLIAYISYLTSTYSLVIFIVWFYRACRFTSETIKNSKLYRLYKDHFKLITKISLGISLIGNLIFGIFKLWFGIVNTSAWFITFAVYYLLLCFMKASLLLNIRRVDFGDNLKKEYRKLKHTGIVLLSLDLVLSGIIVLTIHQNQTISYSGYLIYVVALYDFYLIISAFVNVLKYRKEKSPILISSKCINLTVAMISMISIG